MTSLCVVKLLSNSGRLLASPVCLASRPCIDKKTAQVRSYSHLARNPEGKFTCTLIPGDGVGPELVSLQLVFFSALTELSLELVCPAFKRTAR